MTTSTDEAVSAFERARTGLWLSLQKHLDLVYQAEMAFVKSLTFVDSFPFNAATVEPGQLRDYYEQRANLRDLFTDETEQLDVLTKAIRTKGYNEGEKKQLYLLVLGYMDIATSVFERLTTQAPSKSKDEELEAAQTRFERVKNFTRLNIKVYLVCFELFTSSRRTSSTLRASS